MKKIQFIKSITLILYFLFSEIYAVEKVCWDEFELKVSMAFSHGDVEARQKASEGLRRILGEEKFIFFKDWVLEHQINNSSIQSLMLEVYKDSCIIDLLGEVVDVSKAQIFGDAFEQVGSHGGASSSVLINRKMKKTHVADSSAEISLRESLANGFKVVLDLAVENRITFYDYERVKLLISLVGNIFSLTCVNPDLSDDDVKKIRKITSKLIKQIKGSAENQEFIAGFESPKNTQITQLVETLAFDLEEFMRMRKNGRDATGSLGANKNFDGRHVFLEADRLLHDITRNEAGDHVGCFKDVFESVWRFCNYRICCGTKSLNFCIYAAIFYFECRDCSVCLARNPVVMR
jgi:hypothetical protein